METFLSTYLEHALDRRHADRREDYDRWMGILAGARASERIDEQMPYLLATARATLTELGE